MIALLATGGSTNHTMHLVAIARAAGIVIDWNDFDELSSVVPLLREIYPNGKADVNHFHAAGGIAFMIRDLLDGGLLHDDVKTVAGKGLDHYTESRSCSTASWTGCRAPNRAKTRRCCAASKTVPAGWRLASGAGQSRPRRDQGFGRRAQHRIVHAPAIVFDSQEAVQAAFTRASSIATSWPWCASRARAPMACRNCIV